MRFAPPAEVAPILRARGAQAMFPLSNLARYGTSGHPRSMQFWRDGDAVLRLSEEGMAMPLFPPGRGGRGVRAALAGRRVKGVAGESGSVLAVLAALGLEGAVSPRHLDEPQFEMARDDLSVPAGSGMLVPVSEDRGMAAAWRAAYEAELDLPPDMDAAETVSKWIEAGSHRLLMVGGGAVALTGFNARLPGIVQVGGVYVPPHRRGAGLARRAVALHLAEAWGRGDGRATLFAASAAATRCCTAIGFRRTGSFGFGLLPAPIEVAA